MLDLGEGVFTDLEQRSPEVVPDMYTKQAEGQWQRRGKQEKTKRIFRGGTDRRCERENRILGGLVRLGLPFVHMGNGGSPAHSGFVASTLEQEQSLPSTGKREYRRGQGAG